jgi:hypothetical protein
LDQERICPQRPNQALQPTAPLRYAFDVDLSVGTFVIRPQQTNSARVELWVGAEWYKSYASARMAACDVYTYATGYDRWDMATHLEASEDLGDWQRLDACR